MLFFYNFLLVTVLWVLLCIYLLINSYKIRFLRTVKITEEFAEPSVALIVAVRNEEADLEKALETICNLSYSNYQLILVNDRSTDRTPQMLENFARRFSHVSVLHVDSLPENWLGKSHALFRGYESCEADWLLF